MRERENGKLESHSWNDFLKNLQFQGCSKSRNKNQNNTNDITITGEKYWQLIANFSTIQISTPSAKKSRIFEFQEFSKLGKRIQLTTQEMKNVKLCAKNSAECYRQEYLGINFWENFRNSGFPKELVFSSRGEKMTLSSSSTSVQFKNQLNFY